MNGLIVINKPRGFTSQDAVSKLKKILNIKKAGHTGTLDPLATGVLPVLIGDYTKLSKYLIEHDKVYRAKLKLGERRETGDLEGKVVKTSTVKISDVDKIKTVLANMVGKSYQKPPMFSAVKVNGKKLYEYARNGDTVDVPAREIEIYKLDFLSFSEETQILEFEVSCSKGTYIRVLCEDIAKNLGTVGFMLELERVKVDKFEIRDSLTVEDLEKNKDNIEKFLIKMEKIFEDLPKIKLPENRKNLFLNGVLLHEFKDFSDGVYNIYCGKDIDSSEENINHCEKYTDDYEKKINNYIGLGVIKNGCLKRDIIILE